VGESEYLPAIFGAGRSDERKTLQVLWDAVEGIFGSWSHGVGGDEDAPIVWARISGYASAESCAFMFPYVASSNTIRVAPFTHPKTADTSLPYALYYRVFLHVALYPLQVPKCGAGVAVRRYM
jgi:hypothetical protein